MTREEIDKVIEMARDCNAPDENDWIAQIFEMFLKGSVQCRTLRNLLKANKNLLAAVKQLREEKADLTNRLTDAQDFINERIEKGRI